MSCTLDHMNRATCTCTTSYSYYDEATIHTMIDNEVTMTVEKQTYMTTNTVQYTETGQQCQYVYTCRTVTAILVYYYTLATVLLVTPVLLVMPVS